MSERRLIAALACGLLLALAAPVLELTGVTAYARLGLVALVSAFAVAATARGPWAVTARWGALSLAGSMACLELIQAGTPVRYQHFLDWSALSEKPLAVATIAVQTAFVIAGWTSGGRLAILRDGIAAIGWLRALVMAGAALLLSATVSRDIWAYARELATASTIAMVQLGTLGLAALAAPASESTQRDREKEDRALGTFEWTAAALVVVTCGVLNVFVYQRHPHVPDEVQYLFQARYLAEGRIAIDVPPVSRAFETYLTTASSHGWYSVVPPGWPAVLGAGAFLGAEHWVNPVLSGLNVLLVALLLHRLYGSYVRKMGVLLLAASPWQLFLGMSYMPQPATLTIALLAALALDRSRRTDRATWAWLGGAALGFLAMVRQLDALIAAAAIGLWALGFGGRRVRPAAIAGLVVAALAASSVLLVYNDHFTGSPTRFPIMVYNDGLFTPGANDYGFGSNRGMGWALDPRPGHDLIDGAINTNLNLTATQVELFGWSCGSLFFALFFVVRGRFERADRAMLGVIVIVCAAYFANYFSGGPDFGARYWYLALPPLIALSVRGISALNDVTGTRRAGTVMAVMATAVALLTFVPWRATDKYFHFRGMRPDIRELARVHQFGRALVVVNGANHPDFASAAAYNPLDWSAPVPIYAWNLAPGVVDELSSAFPDRPLWIVDGPSKTGGGFQVVAGPIPPRSALTALAGMR